MIVDQAEAQVVDQLLDENSVDRRDEAAKFVLTNLGKSLGWGTSPSSTQSAGFSLSDGSGRTLQVKWQTDGE